MDFTFILSCFLQQLLLTVGVIVVFGLIIALCRRGVVRVAGNAGYRLIIATSIVGTPIHELSHALACVIFGHKIEDMKLLQPPSEEGTLGYVSHSYNPKNLYQKIGNFFIGIAPILGGSAVLILLTNWMVPGISADISHILSGVHLSGDFFSLSTLGTYLGVCWEMILAIFSPEYFSDGWWWAFIILAVMIASHMELSLADIKGGFGGFVALAVLLLVADAALGLIMPSWLAAFTGFVTSFAVSIAGFLIISVVFSLILLVIAIALNLVLRIIGRR